MKTFQTVASTLLCTTFFLFIAYTAEAQTYSGGDGTPGNPYQISSISDWAELVDSFKQWPSPEPKHYRLTSDLDFGGAALEPVAQDWGLEFSGVFDGQNHILRNAVLDWPDSDYVGVFGNLGGFDHGTILDLGIENVVVVGRHFVGGLVGNMGNGDSQVEGCYVTGSVTGSNNVGGVVGDAIGIISNTYASATVSGNERVGGLIGNNASATIAGSHATGNVNATGDRVGGLAGRSDGTITDCYSTGTVNTDGDYVGGLVGYKWFGAITGSYAAGNVTGGNDAVGGLVGYQSGSTISNCHATGAVAGGGNSVGGLVGDHWSGDIVDSHATGDVSGEESVGGLVGGGAFSTISRSYASGTVTGHTSVGGLLGEGGVTIHSCFAVGDVTGTDYSIGGLAGGINETITDSYAMGNVNGPVSYMIGGFVGYQNSGEIVNCYSMGAVNSPNAYDPVGFLGTRHSGTVTASYWDRDTSGRTSSLDGQGRATAEMTHPYAANTYVGWDFSDVWIADTAGNNNGYPYLAWQEFAAPSAFAGAHDGGGGMKYLTWFGWYNDQYWPWIWDYEYGCWLWVVDNGPQNVWFWHHTAGCWMWTRTDWYPWVWFAGDPGLTWRTQ